MNDPDDRLGSRVDPLLGRAGAPPLRAERTRVIPPPQGEPAPRRRSVLGRLLRWVLAMVFCSVAGIALLVLALRWLPPLTTAYMLQSPTQPVQYRWVPADHIADAARRAVVAAEDQKFWMHHGFDLEAMQEAYEDNHKKGRRHIRGASTISQQTAKNLFLWPNGGYFRKGLEAAVTVLMENLWNKDRILEVYLNIAEFGPGLYGVEAAAQKFFGKSADKLTPGEAARLAAVLPNPRRWSARNPGPYVQTRADWILGQMGYGAHNAPEEEPLPPPSEQLPREGEAPPPESQKSAAPETPDEPTPPVGAPQNPEPSPPPEKPAAASDSTPAPPPP